MTKLLRTEISRKYYFAHQGVLLVTLIDTLNVIETRRYSVAFCCGSAPSLIQTVLMLTNSRMPTSLNSRP